MEGIRRRRSVSISARRIHRNQAKGQNVMEGNPPKADSMPLLFRKNIELKDGREKDGDSSLSV